MFSKRRVLWWWFRPLSFLLEVSSVPRLFDPDRSGQARWDDNIFSMINLLKKVDASSFLLEVILIRLGSCDFDRLNPADCDAVRRSAPIDWPAPILGAVQESEKGRKVTPFSLCFKVRIAVIRVGKQIEKILVERTDLNQAKLAKLAGMGKARLGKIIHQQVPPSMAELERLARALRVKVSFLIEEEAPPLKTPADPELVELLDDPTLAISLRALGQLSDEDKKAIAKVIERFAANSSFDTSPRSLIGGENQAADSS